MVALDRLEEVHPEPFELIAANALHDGFAGTIEVALEGGRIEPTHGEPGAVRSGLDHPAVPRDREGGVEHVATSRKLRELVERVAAAARLVQDLARELEHLVRPDHHAPRAAAA